MDDQQPGKLGFTVPLQQKGLHPDYQPEPVEETSKVALWPERWPLIALQECIDQVEAADPSMRAEVKFNLPCQECEMNTACLNAKVKELGPLLFGREIQTKPMVSESTMFPREVWARLLRPEENLVPYWHKPFSVEHEYGICQAWDIAWSEKIGGDWLVCMTGYVHKPTGQKKLLEIERWQRLSFDQQIKLIGAKHKTFGADLVVIEGDAAQQVWRQQVAADSVVPVLSHTAGEKRDFKAGVPGLLIQLANRKWEIPYRPGSYRFDEVENMLTEFEAFTLIDGKLEGVGEHDDTVMSFWHLDWGLNLLHAGIGEEFRTGLQDAKEA